MKPELRLAYDDIEDMPAEALRFTLDNMGKTYPIRTAAFFYAMFPRSVYEQCDQSVRIMAVVSLKTTITAAGIESIGKKDRLCRRCLYSSSFVCIFQQVERLG